MLVTCGLAASLQALMMYIIDLRNCKASYYKSLQVFGVNALALYVCSELMAILFSRFGINDALYDVLHAVIVWDKWASLTYALTFVAINYVVGYVLYRKKIFIKL